MKPPATKKKSVEKEQVGDDIMPKKCSFVSVLFRFDTFSYVELNPPPVVVPFHSSLCSGIVEKQSARNFNYSALFIRQSLSRCFVGLERMAAWN